MMRQLILPAALIVLVLIAVNVHGQMNADRLFVGSNSLGETADTYIAASACGVVNPLPLFAVGFPDMHLILIANGTDDNGSVRLSQSFDETAIETPNSVSCNASGIHFGNSYYREFDLVGIAGELELSSIELGIEECLENQDGSGADNNGFVPIQICLYYDTPVTSIVHDGVIGPSGFDATFCCDVAGDATEDLTVKTIPIAATVPVGTASLVVEIFTPGSDTEPASDYCTQFGPLRGDVNLDAVVNLLDVVPFIEILESGSYQAEADINCDGKVNALDVGPFVIALGG